MARLTFEIITGERIVYEDSDVDMVVAPGAEGAIGVLPQHAPLVSLLQPGELRVKKGGNEVSLVVSGGFIEVAGDRVLVLADAAERSEEIDIARAEEARRRAQERLSSRQTDMDMARAEAALRRSLIRLRVARRRQGRPLGEVGERRAVQVERDQGDPAEPAGRLDRDRGGLLGSGRRGDEHPGRKGRVRGVAGRELRAGGRKTKGHGRAVSSKGARARSEEPG